MTHTIDASGVPFGRLATKSALLLMGKHKPSYLARTDGGDVVYITNIAQVKFSGKKIDSKELIHHTWHPGGIKRVPLARAQQQNPARVFTRAVAKMLPRNTFRAARLKRLFVK